MASNSFPVVRGRKMRVTKVDGCGRPVDGPGNMLVTDGFVSVALSANVTDAEVITVTNAAGRNCIVDQGQPTFDGYGVEVTFCEVEPCLFQMLTGQEPLVDANGNIEGFTMNSKRFSQTGFALEIWTGSPTTDACDPNSAGAADVAGYFVLPFIKGGVLGDFTIENAAITFGVTGGSTRDGNNWGTGPYGGAANTADPTQNPADLKSPITQPLDKDDHLGIAFSTDGVPQDTDGCMPLDLPTATALAAGAAQATAAAGLVGNVIIDRTQPNMPASGGVTVHWGDGSTSRITGTSTTATHTYAKKADGSDYAAGDTADVTVAVAGAADVSSQITLVA